MSVDKLVDSTQLDSDLTSVANAIRTKGGTSASLAFPAGFVSAVEAIETGGGGSGYATGTFTPSSITNAVTIDTGLTSVHGYLITQNESITWTSTQILSCVWGDEQNPYIKMCDCRRNSSGRTYELWISNAPPVTITNGVIRISFLYPENTGYFNASEYKWYAW